MDNEGNEIQMQVNPESLTYLTYEDVAKLMRVKRSTIRTWVYLGKIKTHIRSGRKSLIPLTEVRRLVAEKTVHYQEKPTPAPVTQEPAPIIQTATPALEDIPVQENLEEPLNIYN